MFAKWLALIIFATATAAGLLILRQQQIDEMHAMTRQHSRIGRSQQALWEMQTKITRKLEPAALHEAVQRVNLQLEPHLPPSPDVAPASFAADQRHGRH